MSSNLAVSTINGTDISVSPVLNDTQLRSRLNATGTAPIYACRAWVNFNGTGTVAIRASGNVSSITDNGVGDYTVNFTTALADTNYGFTTTSTGGGTGAVIGFDSSSSFVKNTSSLRGIFCRGTNAPTYTIYDCSDISVSIFR